MTSLDVAASVSDVPEGDCDVLIIGAGPAGSATALALKQMLGRKHPGRIVLIDTSRFDAFRIGEHLRAESVSMLERIGVPATRWQASHLECVRRQTCWGTDQPLVEEVEDALLGWQLQRAQFDAVLAEQAAEQGVEVHLGWRLHATTAMDDDGVTLELLDDEQNEASLRARWVVDASGSSAVFAQSAGAERCHDDRLVTIAGIYKLPAGNTLAAETRLESAPYGWWYGARLSPSEVLISVTSDSSTTHALALASASNWRERLAGTRLLAGLASEGILTDSGLRPWAVPCFHLDQCAGERWLAVGDSALSSDPISASGIDRALGQGMLAAHALVDRMTGHSTNFDAYQRQVFDHLELLQRQQRQRYQVETRWLQEPFWHARLHPPVHRPRSHQPMPAVMLRSKRHLG